MPRPRSLTLAAILLASSAALATDEPVFKLAGTPGIPAPAPSSPQRQRFADGLIAAWKIERPRCAEYLKQQQPKCPAGVPPVRDMSFAGDSKVTWECSYDCAAQGEDRYHLRVVEVTPRPAVPAAGDADWWDALLADWRAYSVMYAGELNRVCTREVAPDPGQLEDAKVQSSPAMQHLLQRLDETACVGSSSPTDIKDWTPRFTRERGPLSSVPLPYLCVLHCDCGKIHALRQQLESAAEAPAVQIAGPTLLGSACWAVLTGIGEPTASTAPRLGEMQPSILQRRALRKLGRRELDEDRLGATVACRHSRGEARIAEQLAGPQGCTRDGAAVKWKTVLVAAPDTDISPVIYDGAIACTATCRCPAGASGARCRLEGITSSSLMSEAEEAQAAADEQRQKDEAKKQADALADQKRIEACLPGEVPKQLEACEESCGAKVKVTRCVFGRRKCLAKAHKDREADRTLCETGYRECLVEGGVEVAAFEGCVTRCQREKAEAACRR